MKPKTIFDNVCLELSYKLDGKPISKTHVKWATNAIYWNYYTNHYSNKICLECNHTFKAEPSKDKTFTCPSCAKKLHYTNQFYQYGYFAVHDTIEGHQVERIFSINKFMNKKKPSEIFVSEVSRKFISVKGKFCVLTKDYSGMYGNFSFSYSSDFKVRNKKTGAAQLLCTKEATYPKRKLIPELVRNGFDWNFFTNDNSKHNIAAMQLLLSDNFFEWLIKTNRQYAGYYFNSSRGRKEMPTMKTQLKTLFRSGAKLPNPRDYFDYIELLKYFGKDIKSPKYFFPSDFHEAHQRLVRKKSEIIERQNLEARKEKHEQLTAIYQEEKKKYLDITIQADGFILTVPKTVDDFYRAGKELKHCVYTNEYYAKKTLILLAFKDGKLLETAEIDPKNKKVIQCRGCDNKPTEHNSTIVNIIQQNLNLFTKRKTATA